MPIHFGVNTATLCGVVIPRHCALFASDQAIDIDSTINIVIFRINTVKIIVVDGCDIVFGSLIVWLQVNGIM